MPGTWLAISRTRVELTRHALSLGVERRRDAAALLLQGRSATTACSPPMPEVIEGVGDDRLKVVLYHIPQVRRSRSATI